MAFRRGSPQSWRRPGLNVFSEHNSEGWWDFLQRIDQKPKAVWPERFFGVILRRLAGLFAEDQPKAESCLAGIFFRGTFPKAGVAFRRGSTQSRKPSGLNIFSGYISEGRRGFPKRIDQKPKAVWSCTFSGHRNGPLGEPRGRCGKAAGSGRA